MAVPLTEEAVLVKIFNRLAGLPPGVPVMDELALHRDKRQVEKWTGKFPGLAHAALGHIAALQGREQDMREHYQTAISNSEHEIEFKSNYINNLTHLGHCSEAADLADRFCADYPLFKTLHHNTIFANIMAGRIQKAATWLEKWHESAFGTIPLYISDLIQCSNLMSENNITDAEVEFLQKEATDLLRENNIQIMGIELMFLEDEYSQNISLSYLLWLSVDRVVELELSHSDRCAEKGFTRASDWVNVSFLPGMTP